MGSICHGLVNIGVDGLLIDIECHLSNNLPTILIVGFASKTVHEARDRLRGAFASSQLKLPKRRITINLAPADVPKTESGLDLAMAAAILVADHQVTSSTEAAFIGELGLDGSVKPVRGIIGKLLSIRKSGITECMIPLANLEQAQLVPGLQLFPVSHLKQAYQHLAGTRLITAINTGNGRRPISQHPAAQQPVMLLSDIVGQTLAKRALVIAAAGGHNVFLSGPPGTGKSMLARALSSLLPPLSHEEMLEVTHLRSLAGADYERLVTERPLRSPHHTASHSALIGGGSNLRPGEISLSHRGVLLLDEFPEFNRPSLEALRQPLEDRTVSVARAKNCIEYPANFILVATANPCPCGYQGQANDRCQCSIVQLQRYRSRLSGPILDRIDLSSEVYEVEHNRLLDDSSARSLEHSRALEQVAAARQFQAERHGSATVLNSDLSNKELRQHAKLSRPATIAFQDAAHRLNLSARAYMRSLKVARTIADLEQSETIEKRHIHEALSYRQRPMSTAV